MKVNTVFKGSEQNMIVFEGRGPSDNIIILYLLCDDMTLCEIYPTPSRHNFVDRQDSFGQYR